MITCQWEQWAAGCVAPVKHGMTGGRDKSGCQGVRGVNSMNKGVVGGWQVGYKSV